MNTKGGASKIEEKDVFIGLLNNDIADFGEIQIDTQDQSWSTVESAKEEQQTELLSKENKGNTGKILVYCIHHFFH